MDWLDRSAVHGVPHSAVCRPNSAGADLTKAPGGGVCVVVVTGGASPPGSRYRSRCEAALPWWEGLTDPVSVSTETSLGSSSCEASRWLSRVWAGVVIRYLRLTEYLIFFEPVCSKSYAGCVYIADIDGGDELISREDEYEDVEWLNMHQ